MQHTEVEFIDENTGWSGGFNYSETQGGIFVWDPIELSIESLDANEFISFYPNPVSDFLNISYPKPLSVSIFDIPFKSFFNLFVIIICGKLESILF